MPDNGGATKAFEKLPVGETRTLRIYPKGKDPQEKDQEAEEGRTLGVPITMKPDMSSALADSRTDVFVYDDSIVVTSPAVPDEKVSFNRPPGDPAP